MSSGEQSPGEALIVGIDFGTTYSGVGWCYTGDPDKIKTIKSWPGNMQSSEFEKVPTLLAYGNQNPPKCKWGFEVTSDVLNPLSWFKLLLNGSLPPRKDASITATTSRQLSRIISPEPENCYQELQATIAAIPKGMKPVDIVTDFLRAINQHTNKFLNKTYPKSFTKLIGVEIPVKYCLTVPAVWSDQAKALTLQAAKAAGLGEGSSDIRLISEPEAAAVHCLRTFQETKHCLKAGDVFVIADCGGGTVDLISYEITATEPRLQVKECSGGTGGLYGSTTLNRRFIELVKSRLGDKVFESMSPQARCTALEHFDRYLKPNFLPAKYAADEDGGEEEGFDKAYYCPVPGIPNDQKNGVHGGFLVLTSEDMEAIFQPSFREITRLVQGQICASEVRSQKSITGVLLVGGYGGSEYLRRHLADVLENNEHGKVNVLQPVNAWTAIVCGAVLDGLAAHQVGGGRRMVQSRIARFSYGISCAERFDASIHPREKMFYCDLRGTWLCRDRMSWFVKKGDEILGRKPITVALQGVSTNEEIVTSEKIYCCDLHSAPADKEHEAVHRLLKYTADFTAVPKKNPSFLKRTSPHGEEYWRYEHNMVMKYDSATLLFSTEIGGEQVGQSPRVEYNHEPPKEGSNPVQFGS